MRPIVSPLRIVILVCALAQIAVALLWFNFLRTHPTKSQGLVLNLLALVGVGYASIFTARTGKFRKTVITLDWIIAVLWTIGSLIAFSELQEGGRIRAIAIGSSLAVVLPCVINGIAVAFLPPPQPAPPTPP
jgi:hypothetical protein